MAVNHLSNANFDSVTGEGISLVDFWATWCGPCRMQAPIIEELDSALGDKVKVCKVDVDQEPELARRFGIMSIPTLVSIENGSVKEKRVGVQNLEQLKQMLG